MNHCPRCHSESRSMPGRVLGLGWHYSCRDAWHMPSVSERAEQGLELLDAIDAQFGGDPHVKLPEDRYDPRETDMYRMATR